MQKPSTTTTERETRSSGRSGITPGQTLKTHRPIRNLTRRDIHVMHARVCSCEPGAAGGVELERVGASGTGGVVAGAGFGCDPWAWWWSAGDVVPRWCVDPSVDGVAAGPCWSAAVSVWRVLVEGESVAPADGCGVGVGECADSACGVRVGASVVSACHVLNPCGESRLAHWRDCSSIVGGCGG